MAEKTILAIVYSTAGNPIQNALVQFNIGPDEWAKQNTDQNGYASFQLDEGLQNTQLEIFADGYIPYGMSINLELKGNRQVRVGYPPDPARDDIILDGVEPIAPPKPLPIEPEFLINGIDFQRNGKRHVFNGIDQFCALRMAIDGRWADLDALINESMEVGFDMWRIFCMGSAAQNGILNLFPQNEPNYFPAVDKLCETLNAVGIVPLMTCYVDNQDVKLGYDFWSQLNGTLDSWVVLYSGGNEYSKNGFDPGQLTNVSSVWSRGSDIGDAAPYRPYGQFAEFHPRRDLPAAMMDTVASPVFIYGNNQCNVPLIIDEPPRMGTDGSGYEYQQPMFIWRFARNYATMCGGAVFHCRSGQRGSLMDPLTKDCAWAWSAGMVTNSPI